MAQLAMERGARCERRGRHGQHVLILYIARKTENAVVLWPHQNPVSRVCAFLRVLPVRDFVFLGSGDRLNSGEGCNSRYPPLRSDGEREEEDFVHENARAALRPPPPSSTAKLPRCIVFWSCAVNWAIGP